MKSCRRSGSLTWTGDLAPAQVAHTHMWHKRVFLSIFGQKSQIESTMIECCKIIKVKNFQEGWRLFIGTEDQMITYIKVLDPLRIIMNSGLPLSSPELFSHVQLVVLIVQLTALLPGTVLLLLLTLFPASTGSCLCSHLVTKSTIGAFSLHHLLSFFGATSTWVQLVLKQVL